MTAQPGRPEATSASAPYGFPVSTRTFIAVGTVVAVSAPMEAGELDAAVQSVERVFVEDAQRMPRGSGLKARLLARTGQALTDLALPHWAVNAGGDILCTGSPSPGQPTGGNPFYGTPWRAGIAEVADRGGRNRLLADLPLAGTPGFTAALATSADGERGAYRQVSVLAEDIVTAGTVAAHILAGGTAALAASLLVPGTAVLAVGHGGQVLASDGWPLQTPDRERSPDNGVPCWNPRS